MTTATTGRPKCPRPECDGYIRMVKDRALGVSYAVCVSCGHDVQGITHLPEPTRTPTEKTVRNDARPEAPVTQSPPVSSVDTYVRDGKVPPPNYIGMMSDKECSDLAVKLRWPTGPRCPFCNSADVVSGSSNPSQPLRCNVCHRPFNARSMTFFNRTLTIRGWLYIISVATHYRRVITVEQVKIAPGVRDKNHADRIHQMFTSAMKQSAAWVSHNTPEEVARKIFNLASLDEDRSVDVAPSDADSEQSTTEPLVQTSTDQDGAIMPTDPDTQTGTAVMDAVKVSPDEAPGDNGAVPDPEDNTGSAAVDAADASPEMPGDNGVEPDPEDNAATAAVDLADASPEMPGDNGVEPDPEDNAVTAAVDAADASPDEVPGGKAVEPEPETEDVRSAYDLESLVQHWTETVEQLEQEQVDLSIRLDEARQNVEVCRHVLRLAREHDPG